MKNLKYQFASLFIVALSFISCSSDKDDLDTQKPTITIVAPVEDQAVAPGSILNLNALLEDNVALASYKVEIHAASDGHHHKALSTNETTDVKDFYYEETHKIPNNPKKFEVKTDILIATDAKEGHYHLGIFCIDAAGNQAQQFIEIFIGESHNH